MQTKIDRMKKEQEDAKNKNRQLEREINELNIQLQSNRVAAGGDLQENDPRIQQLREEIARKNLEISQVQREYKTLLENPPVPQQNDENDEPRANGGAQDNK